MRAFLVCCAALLAAQPTRVEAQTGGGAPPLAVLDVPFVSQSELLCGGAAAAMVLRFWGERELAAETFSHLVDRSAAGIRTDALVGDLRRRGWDVRGAEGDAGTVQRELADGRPVLLLVEDRPSVFHYVVAVAWHARGVVFHDPARGPFRVMSTPEFTRRWQAARRWMAAVRPGAGSRASGSGIRDPDPEPRAPDPGLRTPEPGVVCSDAIASGVQLAQAQAFDRAERVLAEAISCPGATRELAGLRVLQKRWAEAADLASSAVAADAGDAYAWKVLATGRFVLDDKLGALDAWNEVGEPRVDLVRIDGLSRTRHPVVERLLDARPGELLTAGRFTRARRRLAELPSAWSTRLEYVPVSGGLTELRGAVAERPLAPRGRLALAAAGITAAATRELRLGSGALAGGGEQISAGWRFWPHRPRVDAGILAPAPWGGLWQLTAFSERQPLTSGLAPVHRTGARLAVSDWATGHLRWTVGGGIDRFDEALQGVADGGVRWASIDDRLDAAVRVRAWAGDAASAMLGAGLRVRSTVDVGPGRTTRRLVLLGSATAQRASARTPRDLWPAGDTGHARGPLLRAHPLLDAGQLRADRLGRALLHASAEVRHWWTVAGPVRAAAAAFTDLARTARRFDGVPLVDVDAGVGARVGIDGLPGMFRIDTARGLRDGRTAISVGYEPWGVVLE